MLERDGKKVTEKDVNIYKQIEEVDAAKAKRKMKMRLIYGASMMVVVAFVASFVLPASQVEVIAKMIDVFFKYLPWG